MVSGKEIIVLTSRDIPEAQQAEKLSLRINEPDKQLYPSKEEQTAAWAERWKLADVVEEETKKHNKVFDSICSNYSLTYYGEDERLNIGPKGSTGENTA